MTSKTLAQFYADLGVTKSRSRPHVSNDNPYSEAQFKTLKYGPDFPAFFANIQQARDFCRAFSPGTTSEHRHSGIALLTPSDVHHGRAAERTRALDRARLRRLEGASRTLRSRQPEPPTLAPIAYINRPEAAA